MIKIFVNGSFDVLHTGHLELLNHAKSMGDYLLVALDSDTRISLKKGADRPFNTQLTRSELMANIRAVDEVKIFDTDQQLIDIISDYKPDIMIVGSDWQGKEIIGGCHSKKIIYFDRINHESTTKTLQRYIDRRYLHR